MKRCSILKKLIKSAGSIVALSNQSGVSRKQIHKWLKGTSGMSPESADLLAAVSDYRSIDIQKNTKAPRKKVSG